MGDHFLVREFITVSALNNTVEQQDGAESLSLDYSDILQMNVFGVCLSI